MSTADMDVADVLDAAADYIRTFGLMKGSYGYNNGPRCMLGAISHAWDAGELPDACYGLGATQWSVATTTIARVIRTPQLSQWNDRGNRTADEVIDALMEAAVRLRTT